ALRTQQIIAYETGVPDTVDPLGGAFFLETLTNEVEEAAFKYMEVIDSMGGAVEAIEKGFMQDEITRAAYDFQKSVENGEQVVIGVNKFVEDSVKPKNVFRIDDSIRLTQMEKLQTLKNSRSSEDVSKALSELKAVATGSQNTMPYILNAVENYATLGEISNVFREVFGEYRA